MWTGYLKPTIVSLEIAPDFARLLAQAIPFYREKTVVLLLCGELWRGGVELAQLQGKPWTTPGV